MNEKFARHADYRRCDVPPPEPTAKLAEFRRPARLLGVGFGRGGYIRLSMTVPVEVIERALPAFERALG